MTKTIKLSPAQSWLLQQIHDLIDPEKELWVGHRFGEAVPPSKRRRPTVNALFRHGLIEIGSMGGGIASGYLRLTEKGRRHIREDQ